jgi:hypothetical protein
LYTDLVTAMLNIDLQNCKENDVNR